MTIKKVLVFGTFDGLHSGHINLFKQAKRYGDYLIVVVARDSTTKKIKDYLPVRDEKERLNEVKRNELVDKAVCGYKNNPYRIIEKVEPDIILLGYDQRSFTADLPKELRKKGMRVKIFRAKPYKPKIFHSIIINKKKCRKSRF